MSAPKCELCRDTLEVVGLFAGFRVPCPECCCPDCGKSAGRHTFECRRIISIALDAMFPHGTKRSTST